MSRLLSLAGHRRRRPRRGFAIVAVLGFLVFVLAMISVIARTLADEHRGLESHTGALQAEALMRSAAERARFRRVQDGQYTGETWSPPWASMRSISAVKIHVQETDEGVIAEIKLLGNLPSLFKTSTYQIEPDHVVRL